MSIKYGNPYIDAISLKSCHISAIRAGTLWRREIPLLRRYLDRPYGSRFVVIAPPFGLRGSNSGISLAEKNEQHKQNNNDLSGINAEFMPMVEFKRLLNTIKPA